MTPPRGSGEASAAPMVGPPPYSEARTQSVWAMQCAFCGAVLVVLVANLTLEADRFGDLGLALGSMMALALSLVALCVRWARVPQNVLVLIPLLDLVAVALFASGGETAMHFLWAFPLLWLAQYFSLYFVITGLIITGLCLFTQTLAAHSSTARLLASLVAMISLTLVTLFVYVGRRRARAFVSLLARQSEHFESAASRAHQQRSRVSEIFDAIDIGILRVSVRGQVLAINQAMIELYGLDSDEIVQPPRFVAYDARRGTPIPWDEQPLARAVRGEILDDMRVWLFDTEGQWRALSASTRLLGAADSEDRSMLLVIHDITPLLRAEQVREQLLTMVSHELRHPLTVIVGHSELALDAQDLSRAQEHAGRILDAAQRMESLVDDLLVRGRDGFPGDDEIVAVDLSQIIDESLESLAPAARAREIALTSLVERGLLVDGNGFRLRQVIDNLITNAIKYTNPDGKVQVIARLLDHSAQIEVIDSGIGITPEDLPRISEPYFRGTIASQSGVSGTGLGLGIVRRIVANHRGTLTLHSVPDIGTTAKVTLPLSREWVVQ